MAGNADLSMTLRFIDQASNDLGRAKRAIHDLDGAAKDSHRGLGGMDSALKGVGSTAMGVAGGMLAAAGIVGGMNMLTGAIGTVVSSSAEFEKTMSGVKAVSGATASEIKGLSDLALQLGKDTVFSASEAAKGLEELIKGGVGIPDIMDGAARATLNLATAGGTTLPEAAGIAANAMAMFGLKGKDMEMVANQIAGAANASSMGVNDFRFSLSMAGAVAALAGQSFEETATAIAVMAFQGLKGSDAGTSLKTMLMNLQPTTKRQSEAMRELGLTTGEMGNAFLNADGSFKSLTEIAGILNTATKDLSESERLMSLEMIFGSDAVRAAGIFALEGSEGFTTMQAAMSKVTAESVAMERLNNLAGDMETLKGSTETAAIMLGATFSPNLREATQAATGLMNGFIDLLSQTQALTGTEGMDGLSASLYVANSAIAEQFGPGASATFEMVTSAGGTMFSAIGSGLSLAGEQIQQFHTDSYEAGLAIGGILGEIGNNFSLLGTAANNLVTTVQGAWDSAVSYTSTKWGEIQTTVTNAINNAKDAVWNALRGESIVPDMEQAWDDVRSDTEAEWLGEGGIVDTIEQAMDDMEAAITNSTLETDMETLIDATEGYVTGSTLETDMSTLIDATEGYVTGSTLETDMSTLIDATEGYVTGSTLDTDMGTLIDAAESAVASSSLGADMGTEMDEMEAAIAASTVAEDLEDLIDLADEAADAVANAVAGGGGSSGGGGQRGADRAHVARFGQGSAGRSSLTEDRWNLFRNLPEISVRDPGNVKTKLAELSYDQRQALLATYAARGDLHENEGIARAGAHVTAMGGTDEDRKVGEVLHWLSWIGRDTAVKRSLGLAGGDDVAADLYHNVTGGAKKHFGYQSPARGAALTMDEAAWEARRQLGTQDIGWMQKSLSEVIAHVVSDPTLFTGDNPIGRMLRGQSTSQSMSTAALAGDLVGGRLATTGEIGGSGGARVAALYDAIMLLIHQLTAGTDREIVLQLNGAEIARVVLDLLTGDVRTAAALGNTA